MGNESMTEKELAVALIDEYAKLQRIKAAHDRDDEINYQIKTVKTKLETFGIKAEDLEK